MGLNMNWRDVFVIFIVGGFTFLAGQWLLGVYMNRRRVLPRNFPDDHCTGCKVPR